MSPGLLDFTDFDTKNAPQARKVTKSLGAPRFFKGAPVRLNKGAGFDLEIAASGRRSRTKSDRDFCDLRARGFSTSPGDIWSRACVFDQGFDRAARALDLPAASWRLPGTSRRPPGDILQPPGNLLATSWQPGALALYQLKLSGVRHDDVISLGFVCCFV